MLEATKLQVTRLTPHFIFYYIDECAVCILFVYKKSVVVEGAAQGGDRRARVCRLSVRVESSRLGAGAGWRTFPHQHQPSRDPERRRHVRPTRAVRTEPRVVAQDQRAPAAF